MFCSYAKCGSSISKEIRGQGKTKGGKYSGGKNGQQGRREDIELDG